MFVSLDTSKMLCIIHRPDMYNLKTRKKSEIVQIAQIELSINSNTTSLKYKLMLKLLNISKICYMIQRLNSYNLRLTK